MTKKFGVAVMGLALAAFVGLELAAPAAFAQAKPKVDCDKVMEEVNAGKKNKEIATDLGISMASVRRCKRKAKAAEKAGAAASPAAAASPEAAPAPSK